MDIKKILLNTLAVLLALLFFLPLVWMFIVSVKPLGNTVLQLKEWVDFENFTLDNYKYVFENSKILRWTVNSFAVAIVSTIISVYSSSLAAFAFSKIEFKSKAFLYILVVSGLLIPTEAILIPLYETANHLNLIDTFWGIVLPGLTNPLGVILIKQFMDGIPKDYIEAAKLDGCKNFRLWWTVCMPLSRSSMLAVAIFSFLLAYNNFIWPFININSEELMVLTTGIPTLVSMNPGQMNTSLTASAIATVPAMVMFILLQKHIIRGVAMSGIKG